MFTLFAMGHKRHFLRHAVADNKTIKYTKNTTQILLVCCNPNLPNPYDCEEQTQIQAFIRWSSSLSQAASPVTVNSKARADWCALYKFKCCHFKRQVLQQDNRTLIGSCLQSSWITTCCVSGEVCLIDVRAFTSARSECIGKIFWIIFSTINNLNSALHLTQTYCIPPEQTAAATHHQLDYFCYCFWHFCNK